MTGGVPARPAKAPRPQPLRAEKSAARRAAILKAALDEFCEKGFAATRVEDVAARAGVAKGTIYLNFKDKQALFEELISSTLGAHIARLEAVRLESGQRMRDTVEAIFLPMIEAARAGRLGELMRLMIAESGRFPHLAEFCYREVLARAMSAIRRLAHEAIREGELAGEQLVRFPQIIGAPVVVTLLWTTLAGLSRSRLRTARPKGAPETDAPPGFASDRELTIDGAQFLQSVSKLAFLPGTALWEKIFRRGLCSLKMAQLFLRINQVQQTLDQERK